MRVEHTLEPIFDKNSKVLILGSMPSVKSREYNKYYGNKTNRFWPVLSEVYKQSTDDWKSFILNNHIALWDVIESCEINGSSDSSIKNVIPNDIDKIIKESSIEHIFVLGKTALNLYNKYILPKTKIKAEYLPSPSSANASMSLNKLVKEYSIIKKYTYK